MQCILNTGFFRFNPDYNDNSQTNNDYIYKKTKNYTFNMTFCFPFKKIKQNKFHVFLEFNLFDLFSSYLFSICLFFWFILVYPDNQ